MHPKDENAALYIPVDLPQKASSSHLAGKGLPASPQGIPFFLIMLKLISNSTEFRKLAKPGGTKFGFSHHLEKATSPNPIPAQDVHIVS